MTKLIATAQLVTWLAAAAYFSMLAAEKLQPKKNDNIITHF